MTKAIIFDLDDTLMDTTGQLTRKSQIKAIRAMIKAGLPLKSSNASSFRDRFVRKHGEYILTTPAIAKSLVKNPREADRLADIGFKAYYTVPIKNIRPLPGVINLLKRLKREGYRLYLVSHGLRKTQEKKIRCIGVRRYFDRIFIDNDVHAGFKERFFRNIIRNEVKRYDVNPREIISVGDNIRSEIMICNRLGLTTVQVVRGRYSKLKPKNRLQKADFRVRKVSDLNDMLNKLSHQA